MLVAETAHMVHVCFELSRISAPAFVERDCSMIRPRRVDRQSILRCDLQALAVGAFDRLQMCAAFPTSAQ